jgi:CheY-like chemotaxis protein
VTDQEALDAATGRVPRLLIVDDDPQSRSMMELMLAPHGYKIGFASDGAAAIQAAQSGQYDLMFLDLILPDMSGREVCRQIRQWEAGQRRIPIVAVTGLDLPGQPLELVKAGMDDYVFKPYDVRTLTRLIRLYTGEREDAAGQDAAGDAPSLKEIPVLDIVSSLQDFGDDAESYKALLGDFVAALPNRMGRMLQAQKDGDMERLGRECHSLKGISAGLGAMRLSRISAHVCTALRNGQRIPVEERLRQIEQCMQELQAEAHVYLSS